ALSEEQGFDVSLCSEYSILPYFDRLDARARFFYFVLEGHKREKEVIRRGFHFLGSSEGISRRMERKHGVRCFRAPGGVNPDIFYPLPRSQRPEDEAKVPQKTPDKSEFKILSYGRIYKKRKGVHHVIRAAEKLYRKFPGIHLILFDSLVGAEKTDPRSLIRTEVPCDFHLDLPQSRMAWLFAQADVFVSAERRAGWANTAAEAMACRLPVVCTASGTWDFAFDEKTALVVPLAHPFFLCRHIKRLILDANLRRCLAEAGCVKIREFTWDSLAFRLEAIFSSVLAERKAMPAGQAKLK
ncbi:MAG: glycosyltransferase family 4 protein, partial [Candidatus Aminicenantes bacterium]|nr:glycosyltransferase family 4 protein [Candidatus Aminicenantes bacterium]